MRFKLLALSLLLPLFFWGCVPKITTQQTLKISQLNQALDDENFTRSDGMLRVEWWKSYNDEQLNEIIKFARSENPSIKSIEARYALANSIINAVQASKLPSVFADAAISRQRFSENYIFPPPLGGGTETLYQLGVGLSYDFDFWDAKEFKLLSAKYSAMAEKAYIEETKLILASAISKIYVKWNFDQKRIQKYDQLILVLNEKKKLFRYQYNQGLRDILELNQIDIEITKTQRDIQKIKRLIEGEKESICILAGYLPSKAKQFRDPHIIENVKMAVPNEIYLNLLAHRADISVQKYTVLSKAQQIDLAKTAFYPNISLSAMAGFVSFDLDKFLGHSSFAPSSGVAFSLPLFDGGARKANLELHVSDYNSSVYAYDSIVIKAANEVVATLKKSQYIDNEISLHVNESKLIEKNRELTQKRFSAGITNKVPLFQVKMQEIDSRLTTLMLLEDKNLLNIELIQALGGGYVDNNETK